MNVTVIKKRLERDYVSLEKALDSRDRLLDKDKESAGLDTGVGRVNYKNRSLEEIDAVISRLESSIARGEQRLNRTGVMSVSLRRC